MTTLTQRQIAENIEKISALREQCFACAFTPKLDLGACMVCTYMKRMLDDFEGAKQT